MDDLIEFIKLVAKSPPKLSLALLAEALREYWLQSFFTICAIGSVAAFVWFLRQPKVYWRELIVKPVPEPHKAPAIDAWQVA